MQGVYNHAEPAFCIDVPPNWTAHEGLGGALVVVAETPAKRGTFATNVNVIRMERPPGASPAETVDESIELMNESLTDFALLDREDLDEGSWLTLAFRQGPHSLLCEQRYVLDGDCYFVVTGTMKATEAKEYGEAIKVVVSSFILPS